MVLISACLFYPVALSLIASMWSDCQWGIWNGADPSLSVYPVALSLIVCKWCGCHWGIQNGADLSLSVPPCYSLIYSL